jgi:hypothetical protein
MTNIINLQKIVRARQKEPSYHLASEDRLRVQIYNLENREELGTWKLEGTALITVISGEIAVLIDGKSEDATELCQVVILPKSSFRLIAADRPATVEIVWSPPFAKVEVVSDGES